MQKGLRGFVDFIREQGVVGLAVGFILGGAVSKIVASIVNDIINPLISVVLGGEGELPSRVLRLGNVQVHYGKFFATFVDFVVIALVVYFGVKLLKLDQLDKKKE